MKDIAKMSAEERWERAKRRSREKLPTRYMVERMIRDRLNPGAYGYTSEAFEEAVERYGLGREAA